MEVLDIDDCLEHSNVGDEQLRRLVDHLGGKNFLFFSAEILSMQVRIGVYKLKHFSQQKTKV